MAKRTIVGGRSDHKPGSAKAMVNGGQVTFVTEMRSGALNGQTTLVNGPELDAGQIVGLVQRRLDLFMAKNGARESPELAVHRKVIAAQGDVRVADAKRKMNKAQKMELDMMLSKSSHTQALPLEAGKDAVASVTMTPDGAVAGLARRELYDTEATDG